MDIQIHHSCVLAIEIDRAMHRNSPKLHRLNNSIHNSIHRSFSCLFLLTTVMQGHAMALPAFPGAEGFGSDTVGGRGGRVMIVSQLGDDGPGSLRACAEAAGPRTCVFRTGGIITLNSSIEIEHPFVTIAGQTAPGDGILIRTNPDTAKAAVKVQTHDVVIRYLRVRPGASYVEGDTQDALTIAHSSKDVYNVIIDHSSFSWASDEVTQSWYAAHDVTFQWNIISEGLDCINHSKGCDHSKGLLMGSQGSHSFSVHHNVFAHHSERNPRMATTGVSDIVNNVIYNPRYSGSQLIDEYGRAKANYVGNYMRRGPDSGSDYLISPDRRGGLGHEIFVSGNISPGRSSDSLPENQVVRPQNYDWQVLERHPAPQVTTYPCKSDTNCEMYDRVLENAGANLPRRDAVDRRIVAEIKTTSGRIVDAQSQDTCYAQCRPDKTITIDDYRKHDINEPFDSDGYPVLRRGIAYADSDQDGMDDSWETINDLDPDIDDSAGFELHPGYTNLEMFLDSLTRRESQIQLSVGSTSVIESDQLAQIPVSLSDSVDRDVRVRLHTYPGSAQPRFDFYGFTQWVTIAAGTNNVIVPVTILNDSEIEDDEVFGVRAFEISEGSIVSARGEVRIIDDESNDDGQPRLTVSDAIGRESDGEVSVSVTLTNPVSDPVTVEIFTSPGTAEGGGVDYRGFLRSIVFEPGELKKTEAITLIDDGIDESFETFVVRLIRSSGATLVDDRATVTILD